jgi:hypothetical protein
MGFLFRVQRAHGADDRFTLLGYERIEVLAIEPWALSFPSKEYGDWCDRND